MKTRLLSILLLSLTGLSPINAALTRLDFSGDITGGITGDAVTEDQLNGATFSGTLLADWDTGYVEEYYADVTFSDGTIERYSIFENYDQVTVIQDYAYVRYDSDGGIIQEGTVASPKDSVSVTRYEKSPDGAISVGPSPEWQMYLELYPRFFWSYGEADGEVSTCPKPDGTSAPCWIETYRFILEGHVTSWEQSVVPPAVVDLNGTINTVNGTEICAMVLASGQYTFSCNPLGVFSLPDLRPANDGTVKRQIYADGFSPKIDVLLSSVSENVVLTHAGTCPSYNTPYEAGFFPDSGGKRIDISGSILLQDTQTPICAMVLANARYMFSCDGLGRYTLDIPLDSNGQFKLQVYADGFAPIIQKFDEFSPVNVIRMARAEECQ